MNRRQLLPFLTAPLLLPLAGCAKTYSWRQKLTVVVETPSGERSASSVSSVKWTENFFSHGWGGPNYILELHGEAIPVDLGDGRYIFVLLNRDGNHEYMGNLIHIILGEKFPDKHRSIWSKIDEFKLNEPLSVPLRMLPDVAIFDDISDPASVRLIDTKNMNKYIDNGFSFKEIIIERVNIKNSSQIEHIFTWIQSEHNRQLFNRQPLNPNSEFPKRLSWGAFKRDW